jgi:serine/threonine-protein kinase
MLARPAAIKLIRPSFPGNGATAESIRRFEREAQAIARLRSPHTVELFDFGIAEDGAFYYAMELLEGLDVDSLVRRYGPMPPDRVVFLLRQVCHSLSEAQSCGLVHRDIKPANIFLCRYGEEHDFVKVLDFGIVGTVRGRADSSTLHTGDNAPPGTPAFMAPEQADGAGVDGRADIYATGCLAYWLLTGQLVFTAETPLGLLLRHAQSAPIPPSARSGLPIPRALEEIVMSCLAKDPADRPQSARELSRRLSEVEGATAWTEERARDWWAAHGLP